MRERRFESAQDAKQAFYMAASKAKLQDYRAKIRFKREPYHLTDLRKRKEIENANSQSDGL